MASTAGHFNIEYESIEELQSESITFLAKDPLSGSIICQSDSELKICSAPPIIIDIGSNTPRLVQLSSKAENLCAVLFTNNVLRIYHGSELISQQTFDTAQILAICWIYTSLSSFLLITTSALLFYNVDSSNRTLSLVRAHSRSTVACWFLARRRVLLTADTNNQFDLYIMKSAAPRRTLRFGIGRLADATPDQVRRQIHLIDLYQHPTLIFVDESAGRLHVYLIQRSALVPTHSFNLFDTGPTQFCLCDDVLVVFVDGRPQLPLLFDTQANSSPLISPLPILMPTGWKIIQPDLICVSDQIIRLSLRLEGIIDSWGISDPEPLLLFLMRRSDTERHLERVITDQILHGHLSERLCRSLTLIASMESDRKSTLSQSKIVGIFRAVSGNVSGLYLESVCSVYLHKLLETHTSLDDDLVHCIVDVMVDNQKLHCLQQYLQYHMFPDSAELGLELCRIGRDIYLPIYQLGLDMLYRSGAYQSLFNEIFTDSHPHRIILALRFVSAHPQLMNRSDLLDSNQLLELVLKAEGSPVLFHNVIQWIQSRNLYHRAAAEKQPETELASDEVLKQLKDRYGPIPPS